MQHILRATKGCLIQYARHFTRTTRLHNLGLPSRPIRAAKFVDILRKETRHPIWHLLGNLLNPQRLKLSAALANYGISVDEFGGWKNVLYQPSIYHAAVILDQSGYMAREEIQDDATQKRFAPSWVLFYLVSTKVRTSAHAEGSMMPLVFSNLEAMPTELQGSLLIVALIHLARFNLLLPIRRVIQTFLTTPLSNPSVEFNLLLHAISYIPDSSPESGNQVVTVLRTMESRQLRLWSDTYMVLLRDRFVSLQLTRYLRERMTREGFVPTAEHLEAYLRVFAKNGLIHDAQRYFDAVRATAFNEQQPAPLVPNSSSNEPVGVPHPANVSLLGAHGDRASAFRYLAKLLDAETKSNDDGSQPAKSAKQTWRTPPRKRSRLSWKKSVDVYDWTTALVVAANDRSTTWEALTRIFERVRKSTNTTFRPTVVTYTVFLRGLYRRRKFHVAEKYWHQLLQSGCTLDSHALGIGLQILTRVGKVHEAISTLETYTFKVSPDFPGHYTQHRPVSLDLIDMNLFMVALYRAERPDAVFWLWDYMYELYGVKPNAVTLSIVLQAVRVANKLDDTLSGAVAHLALRNPFRRHLEAPKNRVEVIASLKQLVGDPEHGPRSYISGIWDGQAPIEKARIIFLRALYGVSPERLARVKLPARAIRETNDIHPITELTYGLGLPRNSASESLSSLFNTLVTPEGSSFYSQIIPTDQNCFDYIALLGTSDRAGEISLVLAWMRALGIQPSRATLSLSLVFWAEVGTQAPLLEKWTGGPEKSEYAKLVGWMEDWVGRTRMPRDVDLRKWSGIVTKMRYSPR